VQPQIRNGNSGGLFSQAFGGGSQKIEDIVTIDYNRKLGQGSFAKVYKGRLKGNGGAVAVKVMSKADLQRLHVPKECVLSEVELMSEGNQKKDLFVMLHHFVESSTTYFIALEFCDGGNLQDAAQKGEAQLQEQQVRPLMVQMLQGISFLHARLICHRDVKPHNYLVVGRLQTGSAKVKLADFGIAKRFKPGQLFKDQVGTPAFMAPEIHLLPRRSPGYDEKVDVWAVGVVMVFLLAAEYPFVDGAGRLLRDQLVRGDLPLWGEDGAFSGFFQGLQEAAGLRPKRPSKKARDLLRLLVMPRRDRRLSADAALQHIWFTTPIQDNPAEDDGQPLFRWEDFEDGISWLEKSIISSGAVFAEIQVGGSNIPNLNLDDDRVQSCVVCFNTSGSMGYVCPRCHYTVCIQCLQRLPRPMCPHCRYEPDDLALAQVGMRFADHGMRMADQAWKDHQGLIDQGLIEGRRMADQAWNEVERVGQALSVEPIAQIAVGSSGVSAPMSKIEQQRSLSCHMCKEPSTSTSYSCPSCFASVCFNCTKVKLARSLQCPACGDIRNRDFMQQYLSAGEALSAIGSLPGYITSGMGSALGDLSSSTSRKISENFTESMNSLYQQGNEIADIPLVASSNAAPLPSGGHRCFFCRSDSAWHDHCCPKCGATVCSTCICAKLSANPRCPHCGEVESNARAMSFIIKACRARDLVGSLWSLGGELFADAAASPSQQTAPITSATAGSRHLAVPVRIDQEHTTQRPNELEIRSTARRSREMGENDSDDNSQYVTL
jgi:serine/threonine protein kinase